MQRVWWVDADYGRGGLRRETMMAASADDLYRRLEERGARLVDAGVQWAPTLRLALRQGLNPRELAQVYRSLGRRLGQGAKLEDAFRQASSFVSDPVLKVAIEDARAGVAAGQRLDEAMWGAGLPGEDTALVRAMSDAGGVSEAFGGLADAYTQRSTLRSKLMSVILQPIIYTGIGALMIWGSFVFLVPRFADFFTKANLTPPAAIQGIYNLDAVVHQHVWLSSSLYWGVCVALAWALASRPMRRLWRAAPILRDMLARADAAQALTAFALLYESAIRRAEAAKRVAQSCRGEALRAAFQRLAGELEVGGEQAEAARRADFPPFLGPTLVGALGANDPQATVEDLRVFARMLTEDVEVLAKRLETVGMLLFLLLTGLMVFAVFLVTIFPELAVLLSNA